jgi:uncharacterized protein (TIGR02271 family)
MTTITVIREDGQRGSVVDEVRDADGSQRLTIAFPDQSRFVVAPEVLIRQADGTYYLPPIHTPPSSQTAGADTGTSTPIAGDQIVVPLVEEQLEVAKRQITTGIVRAHKRVQSREEVVDEPLTREEIAVERVAINRLIEGAAPLERQENGVLIIPVVEEVLVVDKRLMLREEIRVTRRRQEFRQPQRITLRRETIEIERVAPDQGSTSAAANHLGGRPDGPESER